MENLENVKSRIHFLVDLLLSFVEKLNVYHTILYTSYRKYGTREENIRNNRWRVHSGINNVIMIFLLDIIVPGSIRNLIFLAARQEEQWSTLE